MCAGQCGIGLAGHPSRTPDTQRIRAADTRVPQRDEQEEGMKRHASKDNEMIAAQLRSPAMALKAELVSSEGRRALSAEFLGTLLFLVFSAGTVAVTGGLLAERMTSARLLAVALAHGLAYSIFVAATLPISGGHLNPAVTFAALMSRQIHAAKAVMYMVAQCAGAVAGALLLMVMIPTSMHGTLGSDALAARVTVAGGLVTEIVLTSVLVAAVLAATRGVSPVRLGVIGLVVVLGELLGGPLTGASMNPARSLGPALVAGAWGNHWIYWLGPFAGAAVAIFVYDAGFSMASKGSRSMSEANHKPSAARSY
jgi:MIP family channel proteins